MKTIVRALFRAGCAASMALLLAASPAAAQDPAAPVDNFSGNLILNVDTNFMSYGLDVWQTGNFHDGLFHPQFDLKWDFGNGFNLFSGVWMDVNSNAESSISNDIQEVDVWIGAGYSPTEDLSFSLTYQEWMYGNDSERILDLGVAYNTFLSPSLTVHSRIEGNGDQDTATLFLFGIAHAFELGPTTLKIPLNVAFLTDGFYQSGEGGFGYASTGAILSVPLSFIPEGYGAWTYNVGAYYYYTSSDAVGNDEDNIITATTGVALAF